MPTPTRDPQFRVGEMTGFVLGPWAKVEVMVEPGFGGRVFSSFRLSRRGMRANEGLKLGATYPASTPWINFDPELDSKKVEREVRRMLIKNEVGRKEATVLARQAAALYVCLQTALRASLHHLSETEELSSATST